MKQIVKNEKNMSSGIINFTEFGDARGALVALEEMKNIPFEIKRVFYIYNTKPDQPRGFHAMQQSLQVMVCMKGACDIVLDDGLERKTYHLNKLNEGLYIDKLVWHEMHNMTEDCVLMILSDELYDEKDNLRDYEEFKKLIQQ